MKKTKQKQATAWNADQYFAEQIEQADNEHRRAETQIKLDQAQERVDCARYLRQEHEALCKVAEAWAKFKKFYFDDLAANNKGFIGKLVINDFGAMNEAYLATAKADAALAAVRGGGK